jgi:hypothetical protein
MIALLSMIVMAQSGTPEAWTSPVRTRRLENIESFASTGERDLRISTAEETFSFDLKIPVNEGTCSTGRGSVR